MCFLEYIKPSIFLILSVRWYREKQAVKEGHGMFNSITQKVKPENQENNVRKEAVDATRRQV